MSKANKIGKQSAKRRRGASIRARSLGSRRDERGAYAMFIAVIAMALLMFGGIAYDGPRLIAARQHTAHLASEAARVAAATIAAGGTLEQARDAAAYRVSSVPWLYDRPARLHGLTCTGNRVETLVLSSYANYTALALFWRSVGIAATGAAETTLVGPNGSPVPIGYLPACPLRT